jgi:hypothetical protein
VRGKSRRKTSWLERLDERNQLWADGLHPEVTVHTAVYGLVSIRLMLPEAHEGRPRAELRMRLYGQPESDRTTAPGATWRARLIAAFFSLSSPRSVPGHNHRIFIVVVCSLVGQQITTLLRERWFNLAEGEARIEHFRAHLSSGGTMPDAPSR